MKGQMSPFDEIRAPTRGSKSAQLPNSGVLYVFPSDLQGWNLKLLEEAIGPKASSFPQYTIIFMIQEVLTLKGSQ